jgi:hypothetical protein
MKLEYTPINLTPRHGYAVMGQVLFNDATLILHIKVRKGPS